MHISRTINKTSMLQGSNSLLFTFKAVVGLLINNNAQAEEAPPATTACKQQQPTT